MDLGHFAEYGVLGLFVILLVSALVYLYKKNDGEIKQLNLDKFNLVKDQLNLYYALAEKTNDSIDRLKILIESFIASNGKKQ